GGVVAAGELAGVAGGAAFLGAADEAEGAGGQVDGGYQFQQAFVDTAQFFRAHVAVVHRHQALRAGRLGPAQMLQGGQQVGVVQAGGIQIWALRGSEQAAQGGQGQTRLALCQAPEDDADGLPLVVVPSAGTAFEAQLAQAGQGMAFGIGAAGGLCFGAIVLRMQQAALFHGEDEDEPVDQAQQLLEKGVLAECAVMQGGAQGVVVGVLQEALTEGQQRLLDAIAQAIAYAGAFLLAFAAPSFPDAGCATLIVVAGRTTGMQQAPDVGEFGVALATQQVSQIDFEKAGTGEAGGVAQQAQLLAVADDAPEVI